MASNIKIYETQSVIFTDTTFGGLPPYSRRWNFTGGNISSATGARSAGGAAVLTGDVIPVRQSYGSAQPILVQLVQGDRVELTGYQTADGAWIQVLVAGNQIGWVEAGSIQSDYPLPALSPVDSVP